MACVQLKVIVPELIRRNNKHPTVTSLTCRTTDTPMHIDKLYIKTRSSMVSVVAPAVGRPSLQQYLDLPFADPP
jgi:hypothetical protein